MTEAAPDVLRRSVAAAAERATHVRIRDDRLEPYLAELAARDAETRHDPPPPSRAGAEDRIAFVLLRDATNFGSGWHPLLDKEPGLSGARTTGVRLARWLASEGAPTAHALAQSTTDLCARVFGQPPTGPVGALMALFAEAWRQLGDALLERYDGSYAAFVERADRSALALSDQLAAIGFFEDRHALHGLAFPFRKRAQLAAYDLSVFCADDERCRFDDLHRLTIFADNLVPHTLRMDGVLVFAPELEARIANSELLESGSIEEIEMRAMAVEAAERLAAMSAERGDRVSPLRISDWLWNRGQAPFYKASPRPRVRTVDY